MFQYLKINLMIRGKRMKLFRLSSKTIVSSYHLTTWFNILQCVKRMKLCTLPFVNTSFSSLYTQCIIWACLLKIRTIGIILSLTRTNIINVGLDFNLNLFAKRLPICHIPLNNNIPTIKICACFKWILVTNSSCWLRFIYPMILLC